MRFGAVLKCLLDRWMGEVRRRVGDEAPTGEETGRTVRALQERTSDATTEVRREAVRARRSLRDMQRVVLQTGEEIGEELDRRRRG